MRNMNNIIKRDRHKNRKKRDEQSKFMNIILLIYIIYLTL